MCIHAVERRVELGAHGGKMREDCIDARRKSKTTRIKASRNGQPSRQISSSIALCTAPSFARRWLCQFRYGLCGMVASAICPASFTHHVTLEPGLHPGRTTNISNSQNKQQKTPRPSEETL